MPIPDHLLHAMLAHNAPKTAAAEAPRAVAVFDPPSPMVKLTDDGESYVPVGIGGLLASTEKLLAVNRGLASTDERDHYANKRVYTPARQLVDRIRLDADRTRRNLARAVARRRGLKAIGPGAFDGYVEGLLSGNPLSTPLEEINPLDLVGQARRLTHFGPGGIGSEESITEEMQSVSPSQFGFISPLEGPESSRAGVDVRASHGVRVGTDGKLYQRYRRRDGRLQWMTPEDVQDLVIKLPD